MTSAKVSGVDHLPGGAFEVRQDEQSAPQAGRAGGVGAELGEAPPTLRWA